MQDTSNDSSYSSHESSKKLASSGGLAPTSKPLRVAFVSPIGCTLQLLRGDPGAPTGGAEHQFIVISKTLRRLGCEVEFLVSEVGSTVPWQTEEGICVVPTIRPMSKFGLFRFVSPLTSLINTLRRSKADVFYVWGVNRPTGILGLYCCLSRRPYVFSIRSNMDADGTYESKLGFVSRMLFSWSLRRASGIVAQTEVQAEILKERLGLKSVVVPNLCSVREGASAGGDREYITWVGSFRSVKRPEWFIELAKMHPEYKFVMIGGRNAAEPGLFDEMKSKSEGVKNLSLVGQVSFEETRGYYRRSLVHVLTSEKEGFPNVILEALSEGVPIVTTFDPDGIVAKNGLGYACSNFDEVSVRLGDLLSDEGLRVEMGWRGIEYVREHHNPEKIAGKLMEVLKSAADGYGRIRR